MKPLNKRLRAEAGEWAEGETVKALMTEAADALELLATKAVLQERQLTIQHQRLNERDARLSGT